MKICKKYLLPLLAVVLCFMVLFAVPSVAAAEQETTKVVAQPAEPTTIPVTKDPIDGILDGLFGSGDEESGESDAGEEIRDFASSAQGTLGAFSNILQMIRDFFGSLLNVLLGGFNFGGLF